MELCFPEIAAEIDWSYPPEFLNTELQGMLRGATPGRLHVDKLVKVHLKSGQPGLILIHIEVQHWPEGNFPRRMFGYQVRKYEEELPVVTVAILADEDPNWRPSHYERGLLGCRVTFDFPVCKLLDLVEKREELEARHSPAMILVLANWAAQDTRGKDRERLGYKLELMRRCIREGFSREDIGELYRFIDWLLELPDDLEREFATEIRRDEGLMPYVTSFERRGREEGREEGQIILCREILGFPPLEREQLADLSLEERRRMLTELKRQVAEGFRS